MHVPKLRAKSRRTLLLLWLPSTLLVFSIASLVLLASNSGPTPTLQLKAGSVDTSLFAEAPPRSQVLSESVVGNADARASRLEHYLKSYSSPLAPFAGTFISVADAN